MVTTRLPGTYYRLYQPRSQGTLLDREAGVVQKSGPYPDLRTIPMAYEATDHGSCHSDATFVHSLWYRRYVKRVIRY